MRSKLAVRGFQLNESSLLHEVDGIWSTHMKDNDCPILYGADTVHQAEALLDRSERYFGLDTLGPDMQGSAMHQTLLAAYDKLFAPDCVLCTEKME